MQLYETSEDEDFTLNIDIRYEEYSTYGDAAITSKSIHIDRKKPTPLTFNYPSPQDFRKAKTIWSNNNTDVVKIDVSYKVGNNENYTYLETIENENSIVGDSGENEIGAIEDIVFKYTLTDAIGNISYCSTNSITPDNTTDDSTILYVSEDGTGYGASWNTAYGNLQDAIDDAASNGIKNLYVKEGRYFPTSYPNGLEALDGNGYHFALRNNLTITGGFAGSENANEDPTGGETILDGNEQSLHVIYLPQSSEINSSAILKNVSITGGLAYGSGSSYGGGIYLQKVAPTLTNIKFYNNKASFGAAIYIEDCTPILEGLTFYNNTSSYGGVVYMNAWGSSYPQKFSKIKFYNNNAYSIYGTSTKTIRVDLENCAFFKNKMEPFYVSDESIINMYNTTIAFNEPSYLKGEFSTSSQIYNTIIWKNGTNNNSSATYYPYDSEFNAKCTIIQDEIYTDDGYIFIPADTKIFKYSNNDQVNENFLELYENVTNPALDMGMDIDRLTSDINDNARAVNLSLKNINNLRLNDVKLINEYCGTSSYDLGAYELQKPENMPQCLFVDNKADYISVKLFGSTSENPTIDLQNALYLASIYDIEEIHIAKGFYTPKEKPGFDSDNSWNTDRFFHFMLLNNVDLIGGYDSSFSNEYDETILSGNIGDLESKVDNCYHVFYNPGGDNEIHQSSWIQHCVISDGYADGNNTECNGGGIYNIDSYPTIVECKFKDNYASWKGGAMYFSSESMNQKIQDIWQTIFIDNITSNGEGSAIYVKGNIELNLNQTLFFKNIANSDYSATVHLEPEAKLKCYQSTFVNNSTNGYITAPAIHSQVDDSNIFEFYNCFIFQKVDDYLNEDNIRESIYIKTAMPSNINKEGIYYVDPTYPQNFAKDFSNLICENDLYFKYHSYDSNKLYHNGDTTYLLKDEVDLDKDGITNEDIPYDILYNPRLTDDMLSIGAIQSEPSYFNY